MLYIGIGLESLHVFRQCLSTKLQLIKIPVVPKSTNVHTKIVIIVLVVFKEIRK